MLDGNFPMSHMESMFVDHSVTMSMNNVNDNFDISDIIVFEYPSKNPFTIKNSFPNTVPLALGKNL